MTRTKTSIIAAAASTALGLAAVPGVANASFAAEMKAGNKVEQRVEQRYRNYNVTSFCDQETKTRFYCSFMGSRGDCIVTGKAWVRNGRVSIIAANRSCF